MSAQEMSVEQLARLFRQYRKALDAATESGLDSGQNSWRAVAIEQLNRMEAEAQQALLQVKARTGAADEARRYYAKPGEAEWGC